MLIGCLEVLLYYFSPGRAGTGGEDGAGGEFGDEAKELALARARVADEEEVRLTAHVPVYRHHVGVYSGRR